MGIAPTPENVTGIISLVLWALLINVSLKYVLVLMRLDNHGEGGILALLSLLPERKRVALRAGKFALLGAIGIFGAALLLGDGVITPAVSVLSAIEGLQIMSPHLESYVVPVTIAILITLFWFQKRGTGRLSVLFGPVMFLWFGAIAVIGATRLIEAPEILSALNPTLGIRLLLHHGYHGFLVLGGVVLVITGGEALYADMGHFGRRPIHRAWFRIALPALMLSYLGQGSWLLSHPEAAARPFYSLVASDSWYFLPMVFLATLATIIASQGLITGVFSLVHQAIRMGLMPRMAVIHTCDEVEGRIYVPFINACLAVGTILLVVTFGASSKLAAAFGLAVSATMAATSVLLIRVAQERLEGSRAIAVSILGYFLLVIDGSFFLANLAKIMEGGYVPLLIGGFAFGVSVVWIRGRSWMLGLFARESRPLEDFFAEIESRQLRRRPGVMIVMATSSEGAPPVLSRIVNRFGTIAEHVILVTVRTHDQPYISGLDRLRVTELRHGWFRAVINTGYREIPDVPSVIEEYQGYPFGPIDPANTIYVLGKESIVPQSLRRGTHFVEAVFAFLLRNSRPATQEFRIPPSRAIEIGSQICAPR